MTTQGEIEFELKGIMSTEAYSRVNAEYERLLNILGNVDGGEITALVLLAAKNATKEG